MGFVKLLPSLIEHLLSNLYAEIMPLLQIVYDRDTTAQCPTTEVKQMVSRIKANAFQKLNLKVSVHLPEPWRSDFSMPSRRAIVRGS
jgi:hypothetical protein